MSFKIAYKILLNSFVELRQEFDALKKERDDSAKQSDIYNDHCKKAFDALKESHKKEMDEKNQEILSLKEKLAASSFVEENPTIIRELRNLIIDLLQRNYECGIGKECSSIQFIVDKYKDKDTAIHYFMLITGCGRRPAELALEKYFK